MDRSLKLINHSDNQTTASLTTAELVRLITTVIFTITFPRQRNTVSVMTGKHGTVRTTCGVFYKIIYINLVNSKPHKRYVAENFCPNADLDGLVLLSRGLIYCLQKRRSIGCTSHLDDRIMEG